LPSRIEIERFAEPRIPDELQGKVIFSPKHEIITVSSIQINQGIKDDNYFTDFIPDDAFVSDANHHLVYKQSDKDSINSLAKEPVKSKNLFWNYVSIVIGLLMIFITLILKYLAYRKAKCERKKKTEETK
jgi:hypothetical protein